MGIELGLGWRGHVVDAGLAVGAAGLVLANAALASSGAGALDYVLLVAGTLVLVAHSRAPRTVLLVSAACILGYLLRVGPDVIAVIPVLIAVYAAVAAGHRLVAVAASVPFIALAMVSNPIREGILPIGWFVAAGVLGEVARARQAYLHQVERRATEAERGREEAARRRAADERVRIARELHDSLTHNISIIKVQAGVAVHLARKRGEEVPDALLAVQEASGEAMRELRATLDVLRTNEIDDAEDESRGNGLARLHDLVERARSAGLPATVTVSGEQRRLPTDVDRAAYRIIQEALTNITRHAGPATASVHVDYGSDGLTIQVDDDGRATDAAAPAPGVGLLGMRERVTALGGQLRAEPRPEGGFTVRAELPLNGSSQASEQ
ncbi:MAG: sensor histidine kinase [Streptosporangiales bacterium]|nr:sensor histidine kinase [Streptosporangiales bacterium]